MIAPRDVVLRAHQVGLERRGLAIALSADGVEVEVAKREQPDIVARGPRTVCICLGERTAEAVAPRVAEYYEYAGRGAGYFEGSFTSMASGPLPCGTMGNTLASRLTWMSMSAGPSVDSVSRRASSRSSGSSTRVPGMP